MITTLNGSNESLVAVMNSDHSTLAPLAQVSSSGSNAVVILTGDAEKQLIAGQQQPVGVDNLLIHNRDSVAHVFTISRKVTGDGAATYALIKREVPAGGTLIWSDELGVVVYAGAGSALAVVGASAQPEVSAVEYGSDVFRRTVLTLASMPITVGNTTGISFGNKKLYDFPEGRIHVLGCILKNLSVSVAGPGNNTPIQATHGGDVSLGTTGTADATLNGTDVNLLPSTSIDPLSGGITGAALAAGAVFDGTAVPIDMFLNMIIDDSDVGDGASDILYLSGEVTVIWVQLGDY